MKSSTVGLPASPEQVAATVRAALFGKGLTMAQAAEALGYTNLTSFYYAMNRKCYMPQQTAARFHRVFGFSQEYLTTGLGVLSSKEGNGPVKSSGEVIDILFATLRKMGYNLTSAAQKLDYTTPSTLSHYKRKRLYLTQEAAGRFNRAFGFNRAFLMFGEGELFEGYEQGAAIPENKETVGSLAAIVAKQQQTIEDLQAENEKLRLTLALKNP